MKSLSESLFDKNLVEKPVGHQLKDISTFDWQGVSRVDASTRKKLDIKGNNVLEVIDWEKVRKDLKKFDGDKINLVVSNSETNKKTKELIQLILSIPCSEKYVWDGYNSRFRDEFESLLESYILPQKRAQQRGSIKSGWYWEMNCASKWAFNITLHFNERAHYYGEGSSAEWLRFEFIKRSYD